jgi:hypothetical protein
MKSRSGIILPKRFRSIEVGAKISDIYAEPGAGIALSQGGEGILGLSGSSQSLVNAFSATTIRGKNPE